MIGMNIKYLRKQFHYSQEELAEKINVTRQSVAKWESEESLPDVLKCCEIAKLFNTTVELLLTCPLDELECEEKAIETNNGKYVFGIVKVGERGQIVIPKFARKVFDIKPNDRLIVLGDKNKGGIALGKINGIDSDNFIK